MRPGADGKTQVTAIRAVPGDGEGLTPDGGELAQRFTERRNLGLPLRLLPRPRRRELLGHPAAVRPGVDGASGIGLIAHPPTLASADAPTGAAVRAWPGALWGFTPAA